MANKKWEKETFVCVNDGKSIYHFFKVEPGYYTSTPYTIEEFNSFFSINGKYKKQIDDRKLDSNLNVKEIDILDIFENNNKIIRKEV